MDDQDTNYENLGDMLEEGYLPNLVEFRLSGGVGDGKKYVTEAIAKSQREGLRKRSVKVNDVLVDEQAV